MSSAPSARRGDLVRASALFDVFRGAPVADGRRSLAFTLRLQAADRTLTDDDVAAVRQRIIDAVETELPAEPAFLTAIPTIIRGLFGYCGGTQPELRTGSSSKRARPK